MIHTVQRRDSTEVRRTWPCHRRWIPILAPSQLLCATRRSEGPRYGRRLESGAYPRRIAPRDRLITADHAACRCSDAAIVTPHFQSNAVGVDWTIATEHHSSRFLINASSNLHTLNIPTKAFLSGAFVLPPTSVSQLRGSGVGSESR